jgi:hypothetical protein
MDQPAMQILQEAGSVLSGVIVLAALILLWLKSQSPWLLVAVMAEGISLLFRLAYSVAAAVFATTPMIVLVWPITGLLVAAGLLGYAVAESNRRSS